MQNEKFNAWELVAIEVALRDKIGTGDIEEQSLKALIEKVMQVGSKALKEA